MFTNSQAHPATGRYFNAIWSEYASYCQLHMVRYYIYQMDLNPDETDPEVIRVLARILTTLGRVLNNIEASAAQDARELGISDDEHVRFVMSFYFDVREEFDDFLV
ncbi:hypothetical protein PG984_003954 [Apiospora sp. TS-2023a]